MHRKKVQRGAQLKTLICGLHENYLQGNNFYQQKRAVCRSSAALNKKQKILDFFLFNM